MESISKWGLGSRLEDGGVGSRLYFLLGASMILLFYCSWKFRKLFQPICVAKKGIVNQAIISLSFRGISKQKKDRKINATAVPASCDLTSSKSSVRPSLFSISTFASAHKSAGSQQIQWLCTLYDRLLLSSLILTRKHKQEMYSEPWWNWSEVDNIW